MYQHIDHMAAQTMAHERERDLQASLRHRMAAAQRPPVEPAPAPPPSDGHHWLHDLLLRVHLVHATPR